MKNISSITAGFIAVMSLVWSVKAADPGTVTSKTDSVSPQAQGKTVGVDDFESYTDDLQLAKAWYKPPHGGGVRQTRESVIKNSGKFSLKVEYSTTQSADKFYSPICRVSKWNLAGCNALQFWFKPDGSGRALLVDLNIANAEGKNIHDLWDYTYVPKKGDTAPRLVTVPFSKLVKNAKYADSPYPVLEQAVLKRWQAVVKWAA